MLAEPQERLDVERLALGREEVSLVEPQGLEILDQLVEQLDVQPADRVDQRRDPFRR